MSLTAASMDEFLKNAPKFPKKEMRMTVMPIAMRTIAILDRPPCANVLICMKAEYCVTPMVMRAAPDA